MSLVWAFAPFLVFALFERLAGTNPGLVAAAAASIAVIVRDRLRGQGGWKILDIGSMLLFGGLAVFAIASGGAWSIPEVRLRVDAGLLAIVLVSLAVGMPFTLQYAREHAPRDLWNEPAFLRVNYRITLVWAAAFAVMIAVDLGLIYNLGLSLQAAMLITVAALAAAIRFSSWYPGHIRARSKT